MHQFILNILEENIADENIENVKKNALISYLNDKTTAHNRGSKARPNYGALYAIYVLVEDYVSNKFHLPEANYDDYEGANFSPLFERMRELPYAQKIQNHYLNNRVNSEFQKKYSGNGNIIIRNQQEQKYWINEKLLMVGDINVAEIVIQIIDEYVRLRTDDFKKFIKQANKLKNEKEITKIESFIYENISENADARRFEIISFAILKNFYALTHVYYGDNKNEIEEIELKLYKTGRTNANDGGIDFLLLPSGRIFQVTESLMFNKYFLDIDKLNKFPITFVIKSEESEEYIKEAIYSSAIANYDDVYIRDKYLSYIEEIITIKRLKSHLVELYNLGKIEDVLNDIILEAEVEFNYELQQKS